MSNFFQIRRGAGRTEGDSKKGNKKIYFRELENKNGTSV